MAALGCHGQRIHRLLSCAHPVSVLGKVYLWLSLAVFSLAVAWAVVSLWENSEWVEVVLLVPRFDVMQPLEQRRYEVNIAALLAGWVCSIGLAGLFAVRAPFRIRATALTQRRIRRLEREVLELRRLPLRQHEEDSILEAEAHLDAGSAKVMTQKLRVDGRGEADDVSNGAGGEVP